MQNKPEKVKKLWKHRRLIVFILAAAIAFIIANRVWFYVMGTFAVIGVVWVVREYNKKEDEENCPGKED